MYIQLFFMVHWHRFSFLSNNLVKLRNTPEIGGLTNIKSLFSREIATTKVQYLFDLHRMIVHDTTMH